MSEHGEAVIPIVKNGNDDSKIRKSTADDTSEPPSSLNDSDYIVELRAPKRTNGSKHSSKKFKLQLKHASSSEDEPDGLATIKAPTVEGIESRQEDICTADNWKSFFSYAKRNEKGEVVAVSNPEEFERKQITISSTGLGLTKLNDYDMELAIKSLYLQEQFRKVVKIQQYHGVRLSASGILLTGDFIPLYHHLDDIKRNVESDTEASPIDRAHMDALYYFCTVGWPAKQHADTRNNISQGLITYRELGILFKPGDFVIRRDPLGHYSIFEISSIRLERQPSPPGTASIDAWVIYLCSITWTGVQFEKVLSRERLKLFHGTKRIIDLEIFPLFFCQSGDEIREVAIQRGKSWKQYCENDPKVMNYHGAAMSALVASNRSSPPFPGSESEESQPFNLSSTVIVDGDAMNKAATQASIDGKMFLFFPEYDDMEQEVTTFTEELYMICSSTLEVFSLDNQDWYHVDVTSLKPKAWTPESFDRLVLDRHHKDNLLRLAKNNSKLVQSNKSRDIIEGKGKGIVLLLHGPPGVGKTLTAEALSECTQRALLKVNLGKIATHEKWDQALEQIFSNAEDWKAILLIDEAEIVLEKRTFERMTQNSWISVFLRKLEYYKGILILTTNLVHCMDEAFESRITYPIQFRDLSRQDRSTIWSDFIKEMAMLPAYKRALMEEVGRWSEAEINGRQIRNIILTAETLAMSDENHSRVLPRHIDEMLDIILEFCDYNRSSPARVKKLRLTGPSY